MFLLVLCRKLAGLMSDGYRPENTTCAVPVPSGGKSILSSPDKRVGRWPAAKEFRSPLVERSRLAALNDAGGQQIPSLTRYPLRAGEMKMS